MKVDEVGQLWFLISRPSQALHEFDREFPVRLEFFRKGKPFYLHVSGKAFIVNDPEEVNSVIANEIGQSVPDHLVLIKVKMLKADYFESPAEAGMRGWRDLRSQLVAWLFNTRPGYKPYHLETYPHFEPRPSLVLSSNAMA